MKLEKVLTYQKGRSPQKDFVSDNLILYLTPEYLRGNGLPNFIPDFPSKVQVNDGDLLLLWDGSNAGEFFKGKHGYLSSTMVKFKFNEEAYLREFLFYQLKAFEGYLKSQTNGSGIPHVDRELLLSIEIKKFNKAEQIRISQILSKSDSAIAQTEELIAKYHRIKTGLMQDLLTKGIDENGNIRNEKTHRFKTEKGLRVPEEWEVVNLESLLKSPLRDFGSFSMTNLIEFLSEGIPFIKSEIVFDDEIKYENISYISTQVHHLLHKSWVFPGNILLTKIGTIGRVALYNGSLGVVNSNAATVKIELDEYRASSRFYTTYLQSESVKRYFDLNVISTPPRINLTEIKQMIVPKPKLKEQLKIDAKMNAINDILNAEKNKLSKLKSIKTGLMQDLLSGKVRVKP